MNRKREFGFSWKGVCCLALAGLWCGLASQTYGQTLRHPEPGDVFKDHKLVNPGNTWRVTDPDALNERAILTLPNQVYGIPVEDLQGATRAELIIDFWGGHSGTGDRQVRFNNNAWLDIPELVTGTPNPNCYLQMVNFVVDVPLSNLVQGTNLLEGLAGPQLCYGFNWGMWGMYGAVLRVYYDPEAKEHPTGGITSPRSGDTVGEEPWVRVNASSTVGVASVDIFAHYNGFDPDGDGKFLDWNMGYREGAKLLEHVGTDKTSPFNQIWRTNLVPDQPAGSIKFKAHITDNSGYTFVTDEVSEITLKREGTSVRMYRSSGIPENFIVRDHITEDIYFTIPEDDDLSKIEGAALVIRTWNGLDHHGIRKLNDFTFPLFGKDHRPSIDKLSVGDGSSLKNGLNVLSLYSGEEEEHGTDFLWPGPVLIARYNTDPRAPTKFPGMFGFEALEGDQIVDSTNNGNGKRTIGDVSRTSNGRFGNGLLFEGTGGYADLGVIDFPSDEFTLSMWAYVDADTDPFARLFAKAIGTNPTEGNVIVSLDNSDGVRFRLATDTGGFSDVVTHDALTLDAWNHISVVYDGTFMRIYVNGVQRRNGPRTGNVYNGSNVPAWLGDNPGGDRRPFKGRIDEVRLYSVAQSVEQIRVDMETAVKDSDLRAPTIPGNLLAVLTSNSTSRLTWEPSTDEIGVDRYRIFRNGIEIDKSGSAFYADTFLLPNRTYTYTVSAVDFQGNESPVSNGSSVETPPDLQPPTTPRNLSVNASSYRANLSWTASIDDTGIASYKVFRNGREVAAATNTFYNDNGLEVETTYVYQVMAVDYIGNFSGLSEQVVVKTLPEPRNPSLFLGLPFEQKSGSVAVDSSGYRNDGLITGGARRTDEGYFGDALDFAGGGGLVDLGKLDIPGSETTIAAWVKADDFGIRDARIISKAIGADDNQHYWMISTISSNGGIKLRGRFKTNAGATRTLLGATDLVAGEWMHVALVYDGQFIRLYLNGALDSELEHGGEIAQNANVPVAIGNQPQGGRGFDGLIDEVKIYSVAHDAEGIVALMNEKLPGPGGANLPPEISEIDDQTISGGEAPPTIAFTIDDVGTPVEELIISVASNNSSLLPSSAIELAGVGSNRSIAMTPIEGLTGSAKITLTVSDGEAEAKESFTLRVVTPGNAPPTMSDIADQSMEQGDVIEGIAFTLFDAGTAAEDLGLGVATENPNLIPLEGLTLGGSGAARSLSIAPAPGASGKTTILLTVDDGEYFVEQQIEVEISPPFETSLWLGLPFEEEFGNIAFDISDHQNEGVFSGGVERIAEGRLGRALKFSGDGESVDLGRMDIFGTQMTIAAWIRPDDLNAPGDRIISKATGEQEDKHFWMLSTHRTNEGTKLRARLKTSTGGTETLIGSANLLQGEWIHVAATYDGAELKLFLNGQEDGSLLMNGQIAENSTVPAAIGNQPQGGNNFVGLIDEVRIYTQALNSSQLQSIMTEHLVPPNVAPIISEISAQNILVNNSSVPISFSVADAETAPFLLEVSATSDNPSLIPGSGLVIGGGGNSRTLTITPTANRSGNARITVSVDDGERVSSRTFEVVVVTPGNTKPTISSISDVSIIADSSTGPIPFVIDDALTNPADLVLTAEADDADFVPASAITFGGSGSNRTIDIRPVASARGPATITVRVSDGEFEVEESFELLLTTPVHPDLWLGLPFEEEEGSAVVDMSLSGNDGSITAGVSRAVSSERGGNLVFSGRGGHVNLGPLDIPSSQLTLSAWIRPDYYGIPDARIISKASGLTDNQHFWMVSTIDVEDETRIRVRFNTSKGVGTLVGDSDIPVGEWTHIAATYDGSVIRLYIDGALDGELPWSGSMIQDPNVLAAIGDQPQGGRNFDGLIDDVRIYTRALADDEVGTIMNGLLPVPNAPPTISFVPNQTVLVNNSTDEIAFAVGDVKTSPYNLVVTAVSDNSLLVPEYGIELGQSGGARYVKITPRAGETGNARITLAVSDGEFTVEESFLVAVLTPGNSAPTISEILDLNIIPDSTTGPITFTIGDTDTEITQLTVSAISDNARLFPPGTIATGGSGSKRSVTLTPAPDQTGKAVVSVSAHDGELTTIENFTVTVEAAIHPELIVGLRFDENDGDTVFDLSPNNNHGKLKSGAKRSDLGYVGNSVVFSGNGGHVDLGKIDIPGSAMTLAAWINPDDYGASDARIISKASGTTDNEHYWMISTTAVGEEIRLRLRLKTSAGNTKTLVGNANLFSLDGWYHVAATYDGEFMRLFIDGELDGELPAEGRIIQNSNVSAALGDQPQGGNNFDGRIDDLRIFSIALTQPELEDLILGVLDVPNTSPSISEIEDQYVFRDAVTDPIRFTVQDVETTGYLLEVSATSDDPTLLPPQGIELVGSGPTRELILTPQIGLTGIVNVTVAVSDGEFQATETFALRVVTPGNKPPSISRFEDILIDFGGSSDLISFSVADSGTASSDLVVTASSDNDVLLPSSSIVLGGNGASRTLIITPAAIQGATSVVTVTVSDGELISSESFEVTVNPPFNESLLLGYPFEGSSATVFDISPNLNNGTLRGDAERVLGGRFGRALRLTGRGGQVDLRNLDIQGSKMTIAAWIKPDDFGIQDSRIVSKASGEGINDHYWMISSTPVRDTHKLRMRLKTRNGVTNTLIGATPLVEGEWTHVAVTFDGSLLRMFVNGVEDGLLPVTGEIARDAAVAAAIGDQPDGEHNFDGLIDEFRIYTQALSAIEIEEIMATPLVDVGYLNQPPTLSPIFDQEIYSGSRTGEIDFAVGDVETPSESLSVSVSSNNDVLVPNSSIVVSGSGSERKLVITPTAGQHGQATITVTASDGEAQASESFRLTVKDSNGRGGWWNAEWAYRMPFSVSANGIDRLDAIAELEIDLTAALSEISSVEPVDTSTLRLVEVDASGRILDEEVPFQFDRSPGFDATTNATGNLVLKMEGATLGDASRYYHLYFAPIGAETFSWEPPVEVRVQDDVVDEGQLSVRVDTLEGSLYYHKFGAGFSSWDDKDGVDWIDYHPTGGSSGNYRGIPNMVFPEGYFHPNSEDSTTTIVHEGPLKATLHSRSNDGKWESQWEFFGTYMRMTVLRAAHSYWFHYEGTPGGEFDGNDVVVRSDGEWVTANQELKGDVVGDEWYFIADADQTRSIYFALHETDGAFDTYQDYEGRMTVLAFGRNGLGVNPELTGTPKRFTMGLADQTRYGPMREVIESAYKDLGYETRTLEVAATVNNAPLVEIDPLGGGFEFGEGDSISLQASAFDIEDGDVTASIVWTSSLDGMIPGTDGRATTDILSVGTHEIRATATDSLGYSWYDSVEVVIHPNQEPRVTIASPLDEAFFLAGETIVFTGSATDPEDGDVTSSLRWVSDIDVGESFGSTVSTSDLSVGVHTITASAVDTHDLLGSSSIIVTVAASSTRPEVTISSPADSAGYDEGSTVAFSATAVDAEDGDLSTEITWKSNIDGDLGSGKTLSVDELTAGIHTITATVSDSGLLPQSASISVTIRGISALPIVNITSPGSGFFFTEEENVVFSASASDAEDGGLTPQIEWFSSLDGLLKEIGGTFATSDLSAGQHVITARVTDSGYQVGLDSIEITISKISQPTNIGITSPEEISFVKEGDEVLFAAEAYDPEDGDLSGSIAWTSNLDGLIGEGSEVTVSTLSKGLHTITAAVLDSGFQRRTDSVTIGIGTDSQPPQVSIFAPLDGARFSERRVIDFVATAQDPEDGDVTETITWRSNIDGSLGASGGELSISTLSVGVHTVTATAIDSGFELGSATATIVVRKVSLPPTVVIEQPASGSVYTLGDRIDFLAGASDKEDGDVSSGIEWYSSIDGRIGGTGSSISLDGLSVGVHKITAKAYDSGLLDGSAEIELIVRRVSGPPVVELFSPEEGEFFALGDIVPLEAIATDPEDGDITSTIVWKSDLDGRIDGQGGVVSTAKLSVGIHTITATALDSGYQPGFATRRIAVSAESDAPVVVINSPLNRSQYYEGERIVFVSTAQDADDGDVSDSVTWTSSIDGELEETGGSVSISDLSAGNHVITAVAVDSGFLPGFAKVEITVRRDSALPEITIRRPTEGAVYEQGSVINLEAVAIDAEDGDISSDIRWHSSLDGRFKETGRRFATPALSPGIHTVTASVLDSGLQLSEASVIFEVEPLVGQLLSDDYSGESLDEDIWQVVDPVGDAIITTDGGSLRIHLPAGSDHDIWTDGNRTTRLMQDIHDTDFEFEARFTSDMTGPYQMQGFQIEQDAENYLRFDFVRFPSSVRLFSASFIGDVPTTRVATSLPITDEYYLRVGRFGDRWTLSYSLDGDLWNVGGSYNYPITVTRAGIYAGNASGARSPEFNMEVDYVVNKTIPIFFPDSELEVVASGEGTVTVDPVKKYYEFGERIELKAEPAPGWKFNGWAGDVESKSNPVYVEIEKDLKVLALFLPTDGRSVIDVWYGDHQTFGRLGVPQAQVNILGNVIIPEQIESLTHSVNGIPVREELTMEPDQNIRIARKGDFTIEIPYTDLNEGENLIEIKAIGIDGTEYTEEVTVDSSIYNVWPRPFAIDWSLVSRIDEVGQVVDGKWELVAGGVRAVESHYDRLIAIGDIDWTDYEVTVPITVHSVDHQPPPWEPLVGVMLRWDGHERIGFEQPGTEWRPIGAMGVHGWYLEGPRGGHHFQIFETGSKKYGGYNGVSMEIGKTYYFKFRVESREDQEFGLYSLKIWAAGDPEPNAWGVIRQAEEGLLRGSLMLVAHYVEATFGNVLVSSLEDNDPPAIEITGPDPDGEYVDNVPIRFTATAIDVDDGDISASIKWSSSIDGPLNIVGGNVEAGLSLGEHLITASIVDSDSSPAVDSIALTVTPNTEPSVSIVSPSAGSQLLEGVPVTLRAAAEDPYDGDITDSISWSSNIDGAIEGQGGAVTTSSLNIGTHILTATATDRGALQQSATLTLEVLVNPNDPPQVVIQTPVHNSSHPEGDPVELLGRSTDREDGDLSEGLTWHSSIDGEIGSGRSFVLTDLSVGTHEIEAFSTDSGILTRSTKVNVTIVENASPLVSITKPEPNANYTLGDTVAFRASSFDAEDGDLTSDILWSSSIDGDLPFTGPSFSTDSLSPGRHTIIAKALDTKGLEGSTGIKVVINTPAGPVGSDDFVGPELDTTQWTFVDPQGDSSYSLEGGELLISVPGGSDHDVWVGGNRSARMLQRIDNTDFSFYTKFGSTPREKFQSQGILVEQDNGNFIRYDIYSNGKGLFVFGAFFSNGIPDILFNTRIAESTAYFMRVSREKDVFTLEYSVDGFNWVEGIAFKQRLNVENIGIYAGNASGRDSPAFTMSADYVFNTEFPIVPEDEGGPNATPALTIIDPINGLSFKEGETVSLNATAQDAEDGNLTGLIRWSSNIDGGLQGNGAIVSVSDLSPGIHVLTASVTDLDFTTGTRSITIEVIPNDPPVVAIGQPADGSLYFTADIISLSAEASDTLDGDLSNRIEWSSDIDGVFATGATVDISSLSAGVHLIRASVADSNGAVGDDSISLTNRVATNAPVVTILSPNEADAFIESDPITLTASALDTEDGDLSSSVIWQSSIDGALPEAGASITTSALSVGVHIVTARVVDSGFLAGSAAVTVEVKENNQPEVVIGIPTDRSIYTLGDTITFTGTASDVEDGSLNDQIVWNSSIDGQIGTVGEGFSTDALSPGNHIITASTTDSHGLGGSTSIDLVVLTPAGPIESDDFAGEDVDKTLWSFVDPVGDSSYRVRDGVLTISIPGGTDHDLWSDGNRSARMVQRIVDEDFGIQAKFGSRPTEKFQNQGILIEQDDENFIRFDFYSNGSLLYIFVGNFYDLDPRILLNRPIVVTSDAIYMRVEREAGVFTLTYSFDGDNWIDARTVIRRMVVNNVGVYAGNSTGASSPAFTAAIDYVFNTESPILDEDEGGINAAPSVTILEPEGGANVPQGDSLTLTATAVDPEDGDVAHTISWSSSIDGPIEGTGGAVSTSILTPGEHILEAVAHDTSGVEGKQSITITINALPEVVISGPAEEAVFIEGDTITLSATATDINDGNLTNSIKWWSDVDGPISGSGAKVSVSVLSVGTHVLEARATDSGGLTGKAFVAIVVDPNEEPVVVITSPVNESSFPEEGVIRFTAIASDDEDGDLTDSIIWSSNLDGVLGEFGGDLSVSNLSSGTHLITATAVDSGSQAGRSSIIITVIGNKAPFVLITSPLQRSVFNLGDSIEFNAIATDIEDGDLTPEIAWMSSLDGPLAPTGGIVNLDTLLAGEHYISASVFDSDEVIGLDITSIVVEPPVSEFVSDDFVGDTLNRSTWKPVDAVGDGTIEQSGGSLKLSITEGEDHDLWVDGNRSLRVVQRVPDADFSVEAKFLSTPNRRFQNQGILIEQDDTNFTRFDIYSNGRSLFVFCATFQNGEPEILFNQQINPEDAYYLRASRSGDFFAYEYSNDGEAWYEFGSAFNSLLVNQLGVYAGSASGDNSPAFTAEIDHIFNMNSPITPED